MPWIIALVLGILSSVVGGWKGFLFGFGLGLIGYFGVLAALPEDTRKRLQQKREAKKNRKKQKSRQEKSRTKPPKIPRTIPKQKPISRIKPGKVEWIAPDVSIRIQKMDVSGGMIYCVQGAIPSDLEPSAIDLRQPVSFNSKRPIEPLGYYSSYQGMSGEQRALYLKWLSDGRRGTEQETLELGYIFVFFYGLERRILLENDKDPRLRKEIAELFTHYSSRTRSSSLRNYLLDLLHFDGYQQGHSSYRNQWPEYLMMNPTLDGEALKLVLANLYSRSEPLHWTVALRLAPRLENSRKSVVVDRSREKFWQLFEKRFEESYPAGMDLKAAKRDVWADYRPASPALLQITYQDRNRFRIQVPNVMGIRSQFKKLSEIWNSCIDDLSGYSRAIAGNSALPDAKALKAFMKLPQELRVPESHPYSGSWSDLISYCEVDGEFHFLPVATVAELFGLVQRDKLTLVQSRNLAEQVAGLGYQLTPDPRITQLALAWNQEIVVYRADASKKEDYGNLVGLLRMLFLTIAVANADGSVDPEEIEVFEKLAGSELQSDEDKMLLEATGAALLRDTRVAEKSLNRITGGVAPERRALIGRYAIQVAAADGVISPDEHVILQRTFKKLELGTDFLESEIRNIKDSELEVTVIEAKKGSRQGEAIPPRQEEIPSDEFQLDMAKVAAIRTETDEIVKVLSDIMDTPDVQPDSTPDKIESHQQPTTKTPAWMMDLATPYHTPLIQLIEKENFDRDDLVKIGADTHLLPEDIIDTINAWADEALDDFLIEDTGDGYQLFTEMIPENE